MAVLACYIISFVAAISTCFVCESMSETLFAETVTTCSVISPGFTATVSNTSSSFLPSSYRNIGSIRSQIECAVYCRRDTACSSAYYEKDTGVCYLSQESNHEIESREQIVNDGGKIRGPIRIGNFESDRGNVNNQADTSSECSHANCASGDKACMKDCTNNVGICVAPYKECDEVPVANIRHYYYVNFGSSTDNGNLMSKTFKKQYSYTSLRVSFRGVVRSSYNCSGCCSRWFFTFNDQECPSPGKIEIAWYKGTARDDYRPTQVDGICDLHQAGDIVIKFNVGACSGYSVPDSQTGWGSNVGASMTVEENDLRRSFETNLPTYGGNAGGSSCSSPFVYKGVTYRECTKTNHDKPWCSTTSDYDSDRRWGNCPGTCPKLSRFNIKQYTWTGANGSDGGHIYTFYYYKRAADTAIRVMFLANIYLYQFGLLRYSVRFDGHACSSPGAIDGVYAHWDPEVVDATHDGTGGIDGMCNNIAVGRRSVEIHIARLAGSMDGYTGWNQRNRVIVEEIRYDLDVSAVATRDGSVQRLPEYNFHQWWWWAVNDGTSNGHIGSISVTYNKKSSQSLLSVHFNGALRQYQSSYDTPGCARWYLSFNGAECSTPGKIATIVYQRLLHRTDNVDDNQHHASSFGGFCDLPAGSYTIKLFVQTCPGYSYNEAYTCWESSCRLVVNEVFTVN